MSTRMNAGNVKRYAWDSGMVVLGLAAAASVATAAEAPESIADHSSYSVVREGGGQIDERPCACDLNGDGLVDQMDLNAVLGGWGPCAGCDGDLNDDGTVGHADVSSLLGQWGPCAADSGQTITLAYEQEGLDFESNAVHEQDWVYPPPGVDLYLWYSSNTQNHLRVYQVPPAAIAFLEAKPYDQVSCEDLQGAVDFTQGPVDEPLDPDDTVLILTADGNTFKVGNAVDNGDLTVTFDYEMLVCPAATMGYYQGIDLETGAVHDEDYAGMYPAEVDFYFAYNANGGNPIRLFQLVGAEIAFLEGETFEEVACSDLAAAAAFTDELFDEPLDADDTIVIVTADGNTFKVGKAVENDEMTVTFSAGQMSCSP